MSKVKVEITAGNRILERMNNGGGGGGSEEAKLR